MVKLIRDPRYSKQGRFVADCFTLKPVLLATRARIEMELPVDERLFYVESQVKKPARLNCQFCRGVDEYELKWLVRKKKDRLPPGGDERDRAKFLKAQSYMVLMDDKIQCKSPRCRRTFDISGIKTLAFL
jgi:hypothetical protein